MSCFFNIICYKLIWKKERENPREKFRLKSQVGLTDNSLSIKRIFRNGHRKKK